jgi:hypothetical protein
MRGDFASGVASLPAAAKPLGAPPSDLSHINVETELALVPAAEEPAGSRLHRFVIDERSSGSGGENPGKRTSNGMDPMERAAAPLSMDTPVTLGRMDETHESMDHLMDQAPVSMDPLMTFNSIPVLDSSQVGPTFVLLYINMVPGRWGNHWKLRNKGWFCLLLSGSVVDPWHFCTDPDPWISTS